MSVKTITMTEEQIRQLEQRLSKAQKRKTPPYARYQYQTSECVITAYESGNMVAIKCKLHNQAYVHLRRKAQGLPDNIIIDQFVQKKSYYRYLQGQDEVITGIHFETKAEHTYPAVAAASVIARYAFLRCFDRMCERYDFHFPKGAGKKVDTAIAAFVSRHGKEALYQVGKLHFANTRKAL